MAVTDSHAVLIIGAGVSAPFGLAQGGGLISSVSKAIEREIKELFFDKKMRKRHFNRKKLDFAMLTLSGFGNLPIHGTIAKKFFDSNSSDSEIAKEFSRLESLRGLLNNQTSETIDDFIVENPSFSDLTKIGIASQFLKSCYNLGNENGEIQPFSSRFFIDNGISSRNWIHLLINIVRQGIRSGSVSSENKVKIITFNYDKILEYVLENQFSNTEAPYLHYSKYIEIIHMHGECGDLQDSINGQQAAKICLQWAEGIHVVNEEGIPDDILRNREEAKEIVKNAGELFFCGFSFAGPNCRLLGLDTFSAKPGVRLISFCNFDGNIGVSKIVEKFGSEFVKIEEIQGSSEKGLGVADWLKQGHLGELPG